MSHKSAKIQTFVAQFAGRSAEAHYLGFFDCFNRQLFFEAHDVLEELWLEQGRGGSNYAFYKGLIQLAGAYVHLQKHRLQPAAALFRLADANLGQYPPVHQDLDLVEIRGLIADNLRLLLEGQNPLVCKATPVLRLETS